jgi:hypothetical protein
MMNGRAPGWLGARFVEKRCDTEDSCRITVEVPSNIPLGRGVGLVTVPSFSTERWLRRDGVWYYVPSEFSPGDLRPPE